MEYYLLLFNFILLVLYSINVPFIKYTFIGYIHSKISVNIIYLKCLVYSGGPSTSQGSFDLNYPGNYEYWIKDL